MPTRKPKKITIRDADGTAPAPPDNKPKTSPPLAPVEPTPETYQIDVQCANCSFTGQLDVPRGIAIPKGAPLPRTDIISGECPTCGCVALKRVLTFVDQISSIGQPWSPEQAIPWQPETNYQNLLEYLSGINNVTD
jgi:hypothetical protein